MAKGWNWGFLAVLVIVVLIAIAGCGGGGKEKAAEKPPGEAAEKPAAAPTLTEEAGAKMAGAKVGGAERKDMRVIQQGKNIKKGGTLVFGGAKMLSQLNPFIDNESINQRIRELSYESLLSWDETGGNMYPGLAKEWEISDDAREITLLFAAGG